MMTRFKQGIDYLSVLGAFVFIHVFVNTKLLSNILVILLFIIMVIISYTGKSSFFFTNLGA